MEQVINLAPLSETRIIAALATPPGKGGIAVIRVSGQGAIELAGRIFIPASGRPLTDYEGDRAVFGRIYSSGKLIDEGIATVFRAPRSFTGEDTVELSCHGGRLVTSLVLSAVLEAGAVSAQAGEFTRTAFLNGKLSLTQAEAAGLLVEAESRGAALLAAAQSTGALSRRIKEISDTLTALLAAIFAYIDFPGEDLSDVSPQTMSHSLKTALGALERLSASYLSGRAVSEGISCVITGKPNAGKSSLFNSLCGEERAIVTDIPGTTRDVLEEKVILGDIILRVMDTAGLREGGDTVEHIGIERARKRVLEAELVLAVFDGSRPFDEQDAALMSLLREREGGRVVCVVNKSDQPRLFEAPDYPFDAVLYVSSIDGSAVSALRGAAERLYGVDEADFSGGELVTRARQHAALSAAAQGVRRALEGVEQGYTPDLAALDIENSLSHLNECDGRAVSADVVGEIFKRFCVGK
ncbi:MAG: tRNA uridine-5-carboxymethylaminomethyl(34) synthesis GTPase MnmE [Eubacteriales bacterium]